ncbi:MAG TPA: hydroxymethylbilane synthase [Planctomycetales bacterium]|jgi:hydroxymethylbilane synthase|nr:hydroxymethylbilane synthase [Planctomycetales bacterium]
MILPLRIGTRGSPLALWQAEYVAGRLQPLTAPRPIELVQIETSGDVVRDLPLSQIGGDGVFTKEIQRALLSNVVDVAVHSLKDLPTTHVEGLTLGAVPPRGATGDVFVSRRHARFDDLPQGAVVATGSLRRRAQALHRRPDLKLTAIRGNVGTRLHKLDEQNLDAIILAQAGLERLGLSSNITEILDPLWMLPAVGQGALGLECRSDDRTTLTVLELLNDAPTRQAVLAERALLRGLGGGCLVPIGARAVIDGYRLTLHAAVLAPDGSRRVADEAEGPAVDAEQIGQALAERMLEQGARELLAMQR